MTVAIHPNTNQTNHPVRTGVLFIAVVAAAAVLAAILVTQNGSSTVTESSANIASVVSPERLKTEAAAASTASFVPVTEAFANWVPSAPVVSSDNAAATGIGTSSTGTVDTSAVQGWATQNNLTGAIDTSALRDWATQNNLTGSSPTSVGANTNTDQVPNGRVR